MLGDDLKELNIKVDKAFSKFKSDPTYFSIEALSWLTIIKSKYLRSLNRVGHKKPKFYDEKVMEYLLTNTLNTTKTKMLIL